MSILTIRRPPQILISGHGPTHIFHTRPAISRSVPTPARPLQVAERKTRKALPMKNKSIEDQQVLECDLKQRWQIISHRCGAENHSELTARDGKTHWHHLPDYS